MECPNWGRILVDQIGKNKNKNKITSVSIVNYCNCYYFGKSYEKLCCDSLDCECQGSVASLPWLIGAILQWFSITKLSSHLMLCLWWGYSLRMSSSSYVSNRCIIWWICWMQGSQTMASLEGQPCFLLLNLSSLRYRSLQASSNNHLWSLQGDLGQNQWGRAYNECGKLVKATLKFSTL